MAFFAIALALLLEQVRPLAEDHPAVQSLRRWLRLVGRNVDAGGLQHGWLAWALAVGVPTLGVIAVHGLLNWLGGWPLVLLWSVAVLYLTLGFRQFSPWLRAVSRCSASRSMSLMSWCTARA